MGYRELLKKYIRHLEVTAGDNYIEAASKEALLSKRDLGELRTLAAEINRAGYSADGIERVENYNYRLRVLMNRYALDPEDVARMLELPVNAIRRWRTTPKSERYQAMSESEFGAFERALTKWLETEEIK